MSGYKGLHLRVETENGVKHGIGDGQGGVYTTIKTASGANCMIIRKTISDFSEKNKIEVISYTQPVHDKADILNLVKYALVEDIRFNNSAEFINWAILGKKRVNEVQYQTVKSSASKDYTNLALFVGASTVTALAVGFIMKKILESK